MKKKQTISSERVKVSKILRSLDKDLNDIDINIRIVSNEIKRREELDDTKNIINEEIKNIEGFNLLGEDELLIITTKMDKTDYKKYGSYPRFIDLERICKEVIELKKRYPKWILINLSPGTQDDTMPPKTFYKYKYKDEYNQYFDIEGIKIGIKIIIP